MIAEQNTGKTGEKMRSSYSESLLMDWVSKRFTDRTKEMLKERGPCEERSLAELIA